MDLTPSEDQQAILTATAEWCADNLPLTGARDRSDDLWDQLGEMGWLNMTTKQGDLDHATEAIAFAELGRFLAPVSMISTAVASRWCGATKQVALAMEGFSALRIFDPASGGTAIGLAEGKLVQWNYPDDVIGGEGLDPTVSFAALADAPPGSPIKDSNAALHLQLLAAAFSVGCADTARDMAAEYANIREQFERPIGWFQGVKHPCADMAVRCAVARSQLYYAACALDENVDDAAFHIKAAKQLADTAALDNGRMNIQIHGGIGMTDEAYAHLPLKRAHLLQFIAPVSAAELLQAA